MTNDIHFPDYFLRLSQIIGNKKRGIQPIIPVSNSSWWAGVKSGKYPKPVKLGQRTTAWRAKDIHILVEQINQQAGANHEND